MSSQKVEIQVPNMLGYYMYLHLEEEAKVFVFNHVMTQVVTFPNFTRGLDPRNQHAAATKANPPWNESRVGSRCEETRVSPRVPCDGG